MAEQSNELMDKLVALCKRRGFIFQSSEIYGGIGGFWDYGPLGVELKRNIKNAWWEDVVRKRDDMVGLDCSIIMNPTVWKASGHVGGFSDPMVDDTETKHRFRADKVWVVGSYDADGRQRVNQAHKDFLDEMKRAPDGTTWDFWAWVREKRPNALQPSLWLCVEADSSEEAVKVAKQKVTRKQLKELGSIELEFGFPAFSHLDLPPGWPRLSPVTQRETATEPRQFSLMLATNVGAMEDSSAKTYLRPETAQGIFCNYKNVLDTSRLKLPFGIAQIGKAFRNEINPRNYTFRSREFEQMEIEFFCRPDEAAEWYRYWRDARYQWYVDHGLTSSKLRLRDHDADEMAHYAEACADVEYEFPFGVSELEGVANRTDFDLKAHQAESGRDLSYFDDDAWERDRETFSADRFDGDKKAAKAAADQAKQGEPYRFVPYVIEPSGGVDRAALAFLCEAYTEDEAPDENGAMQKRVVMKLHPRLAPIKVAVFPLVRKEGMPEIARKIYDDVQASGMACFYDEKGAVGRRYRRQDEAGTPFCVTVDGQTLQDNTVTIRDRDSLEQKRIATDDVAAYVSERIGQAGR